MKLVSLYCYVAVKIFFKVRYFRNPSFEILLIITGLKMQLLEVYKIWTMHRIYK